MNLRNLKKPIRAGSLEIDLESYRLLREGQTIRLTPTEWALLGALMEHHGQVLSHRALLRQVWGDRYGEESDYVHTYVSRLRRKLEPDPAHPEILLTEPGLGYRLELPLESDSPPSQAPVSEVPQTFTPPTGSRPGGIHDNFINPLPQDVGGRYVGRDDEQRQIRDLLEGGARLISVYGRAGVGKTALVCKVLSDLQRQPERQSGAYAGMVILSPAGTGISLTRIFNDFRKLMRPEDQAALDAALVDQLSAAQRTAILLDILGTGSYILFLDNLETLQAAATGELDDPELQVFLEVALEQGSTLRIILTSRYPLSLPRAAKTWERVVALEAGLSVSESVRLLRLVDPDNEAGLRDAPAPDLERLAILTQGYPRALVAVVGMLMEDSLRSLSDFLEDETSFKDEIGTMILANAIDKLSPEMQQVMAAGAIFHHAAPKAAYEYVLAPFLNAQTVHQALNRLVRAYFLSYHDRVFTLHPMDQTYCYHKLPPGEADAAGFTRMHLHRRAADYFAGAGAAADDETALAAFAHRIKAGQFAQAGAMLPEIDDRFSWGGRDSELRELYEQIRGQLAAFEPESARFLLLRLGKVYRRLGRTRDAIACFEEALTRAIQQHAPSDEEKSLSSLGWAYYDLGLFREAVLYLNRSLERAQQSGDELAMGKTHSGLGWVAYLRGDYPESIKRFETALNIYRAMPPERYRDRLTTPEIGIGMNLGDLGEVYSALGQYPQAVDYLERSLKVAQKLDLPRERSYKGGYLAKAHLFAGDLNRALSAILQARQVKVYVNDHVTAVLHGVILMRLGRIPEARIAFLDCIRHANLILGYTYGLYGARYALSLAHAGLSLIQNEDPQESVYHYQIAASVCAESGVQAANLRLLEALMAVPNGQRLTVARLALLGQMPE